MSTAVGAVAFAFGAGFVPFIAKDALVAAGGHSGGCAGRWRGVGRRRHGRPSERPARIHRVAAAVGTIVIVVIVAFVAGPAVAATNVPRPAVGATPDSRGLGYASVTVRTADKVDLAGWYLPSRNGAAVVLLHGAGSTRSEVLDEASVLARNGFGVLMIDARGHGESSGRAMDFGWHGDADVAAAVRVPRCTSRCRTGPHWRRRIVDGRGGGHRRQRFELSDPRRGRGGRHRRTAADEGWLSEEFGVRGLVQEQLERLQDWVTDALTDASAPTAMRTAVARSGTTRYLLITAGDVADEGHAASYIGSAAPDRVEIWNVEGAGHIGGLGTAPDDWEARVIGFLADALGVR